MNKSSFIVNARLHGLSINTSIDIMILNHAGYNQSICMCENTCESFVLVAKYRTIWRCFYISHTEVSLPILEYLYCNKIIFME
jgi:hypothetical protein